MGGPSTILFLLAVGDAVFVHRLFDVCVVVRAAFVYAGLLALTLELPLGSADERHYAAMAMVLIVNAFTHRPVKRWLQKIVNGTLD